MMRVLGVFCAAVLACPSVFAQSGLEESFLSASRAALAYQQGPKPLPPLEAARAVVDAALKAMKTRGEVAPGLLATLQGAGGSVEVAAGLSEFCVLTEKSQNGRKSPLIKCSEALGQKPKDYAAFYIAERIAQLRLVLMPECAEKDYIVISLMGRSWIEVGGQLMADRPAADRMQEWWDSFNMKAFAARRGVKGQATLGGLLADNLKAQKSPGRTEGELQALRAQEARLRSLIAEAAGFAREEAGWLQRWSPFGP